MIINIWLVKNYKLEFRGPYLRHIRKNSTMYVSAKKKKTIYDNHNIIFFLENTIMKLASSLIFACFMHKICLYQCQTSIYNMIYWDLKPYIFKDQKNEIDGIFPKMFRSIKSYCFEENETEKNITEFVQYRQRSNS